MLMLKGDYSGIKISLGKPEKKCFFFFNDHAIREGVGGGKGPAIKEKITFFRRPKVRRLLSSSEGKAIRKRTFFAASLISLSFFLL